MAGEMFGAPEGISRFAQDQGTEALTRMRIGETAAIPSRIRLTEAEAKQHELANQTQQRFNEIMQSQASGTPGGQVLDMADRLDSLAATAANAGMIEKAGSIAKEASQIRMHQATQRSAESETRVRDLNFASKKLNIIGNVLSSARDQSSWDAVNRLIGVVSGQPSPYEGTPYSPELVKEFGDAVMSAKDRAELGLRAETLASTKANHLSMDTERKVHQDLMVQRTKESEARTARLKKAGTLTKPSVQRDAAYAKNLMTQDWQDLDPAEAKLFSQQIAERSAEIQAENPGIKASEAVTRAYEEHKSAGSFFGLTPNDKRPSAREFNTPKPMPQDKKALVKDQVYNTPLGTGRWNGSTFDRVK